MCSKHFLAYFVSTATGCVSFSAYAPLVCVLISILSSTYGIKTCVITAGINTYKLIIKKKKNKYDKIVFPGKTNLNSFNSLDNLNSLSF